MEEIPEFNAKELADAYPLLVGRCLDQSASWILEFLKDEEDVSLIQCPAYPPTILLAQSLFHSGEYKKAASFVKSGKDQVSIGLRLLSESFDLQKQQQQTADDSHPFLGAFPVSTKNHYEVFSDLINSVSDISKTFDPINQYIYASILVKGGRFLEALPYITKSLSAFPINRSAWNLLRTILSRFDDSVMTPTISALPKHWTSQFFQIELLSELQKTESALQLFSNLKVKRTPSIIALEASIHYHHRDFDRAATLFEELRHMDPLRLDSLELYSNLLFVKEDSAGLSELARSLSRIDKFRPETLISVGNFLSLNERHEEAIEQFAMALRFDPSFSFAWTLIGHEYISLENCTSAIAAYTKAYDANPRDFRALFGLGNAFELSSMPHQAIQYYRSAILINPFDSRMWLALGSCYEQVDQKENAIRCFQRAVCNAESEGEAIFHLARLYKDGEDNDRAAFCYESYIEKFAQGSDEERKEGIKEANDFLANYYREKKIWKKAEFYAQKLMTDSSTIGEAKSILKDLRQDRK